MWRRWRKIQYLLDSDNSCIWSAMSHFYSQIMYVLHINTENWIPCSTHGYHEESILSCSVRKSIKKSHFTTLRAKQNEKTTFPIAWQNGHVYIVELPISLAQYSKIRLFEWFSNTVRLVSTAKCSDSKILLCSSSGCFPWEKVSKVLQYLDWRYCTAPLHKNLLFSS